MFRGPGQRLLRGDVPPGGLVSGEGHIKSEFVVNLLTRLLPFAIEYPNIGKHGA